MHALPLSKAVSARPSRHYNRRLDATSPLAGAAFANYTVEVAILAAEPVVLSVVVDSGSSDFAVAAASTSADCTIWYDGECAGPHVSAKYGTGMWLGHVCSGHSVQLGGLDAGAPDFAGITQQNAFLTNCAPSYPGILSQGIVGMAYPSLLTTPLTETLFESGALDR